MSEDLFSASPYVTNSSVTHAFYLVDIENNNTLQYGEGAKVPDEGLGLLWLRYVLLAGSLLLLVFLSFGHYHIKHGNRYQRRRRFAALRKLNVAAMLHQMHEQVEIMGAPEHQQQGEDGSTTRCVTPCLPLPTGNSESHGGGTKRKRKLFAGRWSSCSRLKAKDGYSEVFASNDNGSMINMQMDSLLQQQTGDTWSVSHAAITPTADGLSLPLIVTDDVDGDVTADACHLATNVTLESFLHLSASTRSVDATYA